MTLTQLFNKDYQQLTPQNLYSFKRTWSKRLGRMPKNSEIIDSYKELLASKAITRNSNLENILKTRKVRSLSGVTPMAVMTKPYTCPGQCVFCPLELGMPKSYLSDEPAAQRAKTLDFDPVLQIKSRLLQLKKIGHITSKVELIVIGATFSAYPDHYKQEFFKGMFDACNGFTSPNLEKAQEANETANHRIVGISIETRPDWVTPKEVKLLRFLGVTKIQMGVQAFDDEILAKSHRGHGLAEVEQATRLLRNAGFKICYHYMPNLPGSNPQKDVEMAKLMYTDPRFNPDYVKIYPCMIIPKTKLYRMWERGEHSTYDDDTMRQLLKEIKLLTPQWCRIDRLVRDISKQWVSSGTHQTNMRQIIQQELAKEGKACQCIRCREIKERDFSEQPKLLIRKYETSGGKEYFLSFESDNRLYSLLRLRLPTPDQVSLFDELKHAALIREVHTFGTVRSIDETSKVKTQHQGLGKQLLEKAEIIASEKGFKKLAVISAIGTRNYYRKYGFERDGIYMTKAI